MWKAPDGTRMSRESLNLRGQVWEIDADGRQRVAMECQRG